MSKDTKTGTFADLVGAPENKNSGKKFSRIERRRYYQGRLAARREGYVDGVKGRRARNIQPGAKDPWGQGFHHEYPTSYRIGERKRHYGIPSPVRKRFGRTGGSSYGRSGSGGRRGYRGGSGRRRYGNGYRRSSYSGGGSRRSSYGGGGYRRSNYRGGGYRRGGYRNGGYRRGGRRY